MSVMRQKKLSKGIIIMLCSSLLTCTGQLLWKFFSDKNIILYLFAGFCLYGGGALLMIIALRYGDLSQLHPLLSIGYIMSIFLGAFILKEPVTMMKVVGIALIIIGICLVYLPGRKSL